MNKLLATLILIVASAGAGAFAFVRSGGSLRAMLVGRETHRVTPAMLAATDARAKAPAPTFRAVATDGVTYDLAGLTASTPLVLVFIKDGCPCSSDAQRFFDRLNLAYGRQVRFLGVIDADADGGRAWGQRNRTTFPILVDPDLNIARAYGAESSAYAAVVDRGGTIDHVYPGYSSGMIAEMGERIARLAGVAPRPVDASGAPEELSTGCPLASRLAD